MFCLICQTEREFIYIENFHSVDGQPMVRVKCTVCGKQKTEFIKTSNMQPVNSAPNPNPQQYKKL